ncbi:hypothetical protein [uncultured Dysgonomonas sp.]|uniref:hypothetical protein n=1 Tax=uncultured Dysgonomonas sp. TaxID=206096 RepID=UPI0026122749|nr:hypothetical protein [uncultured Dysgonomonas sp.]
MPLAICSGGWSWWGFSWYWDAAASLFSHGSMTAGGRPLFEVLISDQQSCVSNPIQDKRFFTPFTEGDNTVKNNR